MNYLNLKDILEGNSSTGAYESENEWEGGSENHTEIFIEKFSLVFGSDEDTPELIEPDDNIIEIDEPEESDEELDLGDNIMALEEPNIEEAEIVEIEEPEVEKLQVFQLEEHELSDENEPEEPEENVKIEGAYDNINDLVQKYSEYVLNK